MEKRFFQFIALVIAVVLIYRAWHPFWRYDLNEAVDSDSSTKVIFEVERGSSAKTIASNLEDAELIVNDKSFLRTVEGEELDGLLRYGRFVLSPSMSLREIITILTTEGTGEMALTVPEGWTINEIDAELTEMGLITAGSFRLCTFNCSFDYDFLPEEGIMEGFLFPDTYFIDQAAFSSEGLIDQMLANFDRKLTDEMRADVEASGRSLSETIIVASMIEREVFTSADIPVVGGIIWKRLDNNWTLGIDATLLYIDDDNIITWEELQNDSPYNTRLNTGLPPTAISNPGLASIEGAIYAEESDYWFYLTDMEGNVHYAITNEEHEANKEKYL